MTREELLEKLHSITFHAILTALTSEECLEVITFTSEGTCYSWIGYDDWNIYELRGIDSDRWSQIRSKILQGNLDKCDIDETDFIKLIGNDKSDINYNVFFAGIKNLPVKLPEKIYCINDSPAPEFFQDESSLAKALAEYYPACGSVWEEMNTEELEHWYSEYENSCEFPYCRFNDEG